jgi:hypothetical protein
VLAATSRSTSRSPAPRGAGPRAVTGGSERSRSLFRGPGRSSSRRDEAAASGAAQLLRHGTARGLRQGDSSSSETPQHRPVILEDLLLLCLRGVVRPFPQCTPEVRTRGSSADRTTPCASRCSSRSGTPNVVVAPALLHLEVGAADRHRPRTLLQACELEEIPKKVPMGTDSQVPSHIASNAAICWMLFGLRCYN